MGARQETKCAKCSTKELILKVALDEFALYSLEGSTTRKIAEKAGINHACINYYFGSKEEMYFEILRRAVSIFQAYYAEIFSEVDSFKKSKNKNTLEAKNLLKKLMQMHFLAIDNGNFASLHLIMRREEMYPTKGFDILYKGAYKPMNDMISTLILYASQKKISSKQAHIEAVGLLFFNASTIICRRGLLRLLKLKKFSAKNSESIRKITSDAIDKLLK